MFKIRKLKCGAHLITDYDASANSADMGIAFKVGAVDETLEISGISHFIEHLMFKGTEKRDARKISEDMELIGGHINAFTTNEFTCYYFKSLSETVEKGAEILLDMVMNSSMKEKEIDRERHVIFEEINMSNDAYDDFVIDRGGRLAAEGTPLSHSILGTKESLSQIHRMQILHYIDSYYTLDRMVIALTGNFPEERLIDILERELCKLKQKSSMSCFCFGEYKPGFLTKIRESEQSNVFLGIPVVKLGDPLLPAVKVLVNALGGTMSSRLFYNIRERKGLAYAINAFVTAGTHGGHVGIYSGIAHENVEKTLEAIKFEIGELAEKGLTDVEIEKSKIQLKSGIVFNDENNTGMLFSLIRQWILRSRIETTEERMKKIDEVGRKELKEAAEIVCDTKKFSGALVTGRNLDLENLWRC